MKTSICETKKKNNRLKWSVLMLVLGFVACGKTNEKKGADGPAVGIPVYEDGAFEKDKTALLAVSDEFDAEALRSDYTPAARYDEMKALSDQISIRVEAIIAKYEKNHRYKSDSSSYVRYLPDSTVATLRKLKTDAIRLVGVAQAKAKKYKESHGGGTPGPRPEPVTPGSPLPSAGVTVFTGTYRSTVSGTAKGSRTQCDVEIPIVHKPSQLTIQRMDFSCKNGTSSFTDKDITYTIQARSDQSSDLLLNGNVMGSISKEGVIDLVTPEMIPMYYTFRIKGQFGRDSFSVRSITIDVTGLGRWMEFYGVELSKRN